ncbi:pyrroloquinoline quinone-dependent dehydrogenase [Acidisphaera rubrifaciens]|uniref:Alcohol dehydrogenase PQQ-dependent, large subunit n=1 Tax=Acidisphaera rubrifaciens HS-AP3 TaxID=1231350 RepID=A0A0D6P9S3_9PROT|nr:PQQ-binding-like beta-propeller repeat protein [Acidisphaera rubrifaciens]GAN78412.1 alcohol dehydrogenase PQQ-dependent, large subunit [Acidisphaera rubrifaciens HS-AP3]
MTLRDQWRCGSAIVKPAATGAALMGLAAVGLAGAAALSTPARAQDTPTAEEFAHAASDAADWILPAKSYTGNHYTTAAQITPANVADLKLAWKFTINDTGPLEVSPIVYHGTMYVTSAHDHVYALDAATGKLKWQFSDSPHVISFAANRGIALLDGNVYLGTLDGHLIALDAKTGAKVWDKVTVDDTANSFYTMAPVPYHDASTNRDELLLGVSDGDWGGNGNIAAYDPKDGHVLWRWETVPGPGEPGHETWSGDSWKRGGASTWGGVTIDTATHMMYLNLGNPGPDFLGSVREGANLYSDSMVALDISGSKPTLKWYHQFIPHDTHDWDPPMQPVLFTGKHDGADVKMVATGDKAGNFWILDAASGKLLNHTVTSFQKGIADAPSVEGNIACPNTLGGIEYQGGAFDPSTNDFYVPSQNECGRWTASKDVIYIAGQFYLGGDFPKLVGPNTGQMNAINVDTGIFDWRHHFNLPNYGGALVTASGLVFSGNLGGRENAFDTKTGKLLWSYDTGAFIQAPTEAYEAGGHEYIVVAAGQAGNAAIPELPKGDQTPVICAFTSK